MKLISWLENQLKKFILFLKKQKLIKNEIEKESIQPRDYFALARSWADDFYVSVETSRNRWRAATLYLLTPLSALLLLCITFLIPSQHLVPLIIQHYQDGQVVVTPFKQQYAPKNSAEVESDIAKYIRFRESYSSETYNYSYRLIELMSSADVAKQYETSQSASNKNSPINVLGNKEYQNIKIENIIFLDSAYKNKQHKLDRSHQNLAQVDFVLTTCNKHSGMKIQTPLVALISWEYKGMPENPSQRWMNWNGFQVQSYQIHRRNI